MAADQAAGEAVLGPDACSAIHASTSRRVEMREPGTGDEPGPGEFVMDIRVPKPQARKDGGEGRPAGERKTG